MNKWKCDFMKKFNNDLRNKNLAQMMISGLPCLVLLVLAAFVGLQPMSSVQAKSRDGVFWDESAPKGVGISDDAPVVYGDFHRLAKAMSPTVVNIQTMRKVGGGQMSMDSQDMEFFRRFFGFAPFQSEPRSVPGLGSGFIITSDGYILTNNHVIEDAQELKVTLADDREFDGKVVGTDPRTDLALVKIEAKGLPVAPLGNSDALEVGEWVVAIGNPFNFSHTVTAGIVSAKGRRQVQPGSRQLYADFIQTDASINPGNSGGPLFNIRGQVVGVNSAIYSRDGAYQGIGFAIPVNMAKTILPSLKEKGSVERSWLGVMIQAVDKDLASSFGMDKAKGALVAQVSENSPAQSAGLMQGDVILKFDGKDIGESSDLPWMASNAGIGREVSVVILRNGKEKTMKVKLARYPDEDGEVAVSGGAPGSGSGISSLGLRVSKVPAQVSERYGLDGDKGVLVTGVDHGSMVMRGGIQPNDVILEVNGKKVNSPAELEKLISGMSKKQYIRLLVARENSRRFVAFKMP